MMCPDCNVPVSAVKVGVLRMDRHGIFTNELRFEGTVCWADFCVFNADVKTWINVSTVPPSCDLNYTRFINSDIEAC